MNNYYPKPKRGEELFQKRISSKQPHTNKFYNEEQLVLLRNKWVEIFKQNNLNTSRVFKLFNRFKSHNVNFINSRMKRLMKDNKPRASKWLMFLMYGNIDGRKLWAEYCDRQSKTNSKEYKNMTDQEFDEYNKSRAVTKKNLIKRYGNKEGVKRWNEYIEKQRYTKSLQRYIDEFGEDEGLRIYREINKKKINAVSSFSYSKSSQELFRLIEQKLGSKCYYGEQEKIIEYINNKTDLKYKFYMVDFYCPDYNFIIEFDGDYYHANPAIYDEECVMNFGKNKTAKEIREYDEKKSRIILEKGYRLLRIWEYTYNKQKDNIDEFINDIIDHIINTDIIFYRV